MSVSAIDGYVIPYEELWGLSDCQKRKIRLCLARLKGTHTEDQWQNLIREFDFHCVWCGVDREPMTKDHILPIYQGGSDSISNIQPLCRRCNSRKGPYPADWAAYRRQFGFEVHP